MMIRAGGFRRWGIFCAPTWIRADDPVHDRLKQSDRMNRMNRMNRQDSGAR